MWDTIKIKHFLLLVALLSTFHHGNGMFEWLFGKSSDGSGGSSDTKEPTTRFEVLSTDEKFLDFATTLADLSPLDACYHVVRPCSLLLAQYLHQQYKAIVEASF
jgi:hypothetical protein